jgi:hypothetical protein
MNEYEDRSSPSKCYYDESGKQMLYSASSQNIDPRMIIDFFKRVDETILTSSGIVEKLERRKCFFAMATIVFRRFQRH